ncbi:unnamed protein product [Sphagnum jensenii]|uniref:Uncharacterized protein n=1 Tax=Sphagnum jensenii TaxID=128206 RepID=A0ABP1BTB9_9BRYO
MSMKCTMPFQLSHCLEYGLTIMGRDVKKAVSRVECNFCVYIGRSGDDVGCKCMQIESICLFTLPYRPKLYCKHLKKQHVEGWLEYQGLSKAKKQMFFDQQKKATINRFFCIANDVLEMTIASKIVDELIRDLYFHLDDDVGDEDDWPISKANTMKLFQLDEGGATYSMTIKNLLRFGLAINHTFSNFSFWQTIAIIEQHRVQTKNPKLMGLNDHMVSKFIHILVVADLQMISEILSEPCVFAFSIAGDDSTHYESSYFDIRIRVGINGVLHNLHLVIV